MSGGRVYLIGAGPGDPGLITVRAVEVLARCDVIVYDHLVDERLLDHAPRRAERIYAGKQAGEHTLSQERISALLVERARTGATVGRLKGGDPFIFGRGGEEALALAEAGIDFEIIPGVTAGIAAAAYAGIPLTHRHLAGAVALIAGHEAPDKAESDLNLGLLAQWPGTLVFYMGVRNLKMLCDGLIGHGLDTATPAAVIRWGATPRQQVTVGTVASLPGLAEQANVKPPAIIVIGKVVALRQKLQWFERRPLLGRKIVVTRARAQASGLADRLTELGAEVLLMPTIRVVPPDDPAPLRQAVAVLRSFDWIVLTSVNGVDALCAAIHEAGMDSRVLSGVKICSIGPATGERLAGHGIRPDAQPGKFVTAEIAAAMAAVQSLSGAAVLCPRSDLGAPELVNDLTASGATVREVTAYRTIADAADTADADGVRAGLAEGSIDWITFTSSSTVRFFFQAVDVESVRTSGVRLVSIGPVTSQTLRQCGIEPTVEAKVHTTGGLVDAILAAPVR